MSSDLYGIRVLVMDASTVKLNVFMVYCDRDHIPASKDFFLSILLILSIYHYPAKARKTEIVNK